MEILDVNITELEKHEILENFSSMSKGYICVTSVHGLIESYEDTSVQRAFRESTYNIPDGMPIVLFGKYIRKISTFTRMYGPQFLIDFLNYNNKNNIKIFTIGSNENNLLKFKNILDAKYKNINLVGHNFEIIDINNEHQIDKIYRELSDIEVDYVLVFLSTPKQDVLMHRLISRGSNLKFIGFGAAVDFFIGDLKSPPVIMQNLSLEWLYRLIQEPRRLYKRYLKIVPKFLYIMIFRNLFIKSKDS